MSNIKKSLISLRGVFAVISLLVPSVSSAMEVEQDEKILNRSLVKQDSPKKCSEKEIEFKDYVDKHRDAAKRASKNADKYLKLNPPKSKKHQK